MCYTRTQNTLIHKVSHPQVSQATFSDLFSLRSCSNLKLASFRYKGFNMSTVMRIPLLITWWSFRSWCFRVWTVCCLCSREVQTISKNKIPAARPTVALYIVNVLELLLDFQVSTLMKQSPLLSFETYHQNLLGSLCSCDILSVMHMLNFFIALGQWDALKYICYYHLYLSFAHNAD